MANMSYCRFENTLSDLQDCVDNWENRDISESERKCREELLELCYYVVDAFGDEWEDEEDEEEEPE